MILVQCTRLDYYFLVTLSPSHSSMRDLFCLKAIMMGSMALSDSPVEKAFFMRLVEIAARAFVEAITLFSLLLCDQSVRPNSRSCETLSKGVH